MNTSTIRIMMIEDNLGDAMLIGEMLKEAKNRRYLLQHNLQLSTAFECIDHKSFDIILLDLGLPDSTGLGTLKKVLEKAPSIPVVIMTGLDDEELGFEAVKMGAQDYLIKGQIDTSLLFRTIRYSIERKNIEKALKEAYPAEIKKALSL
ncbi:MAG: response regulator [Bacteroidota bacterium]|jgi:DNA-binding response OmpR family regulator|nr:response regulator [Ignavibacteria bacterium]